MSFFCSECADNYRRKLKRRLQVEIINTIFKYVVMIREYLKNAGPYIYSESEWFMSADKVYEYNNVQ